MHLYELTELGLPSASPSVPEWALGCFRRRSITFHDGSEDASTEVLWLQSRQLTADLRCPRGTPRVRAPGELGALGPEQLGALARVEGGLARASWDGALMSWSGWHGFQAHVRWPEPGRLARVGRCLIELAPSGAYVEDWRLEPGGDGPLIGLALLEERERESGALLHRGGGLVVCGQHAAFVRGRAEPLPEGRPLEELARAARGDPARLAQLFACDAAYARGGPEGYAVELSTQPWRAGQPLLSLTGFELDAGYVVQHAEEGGRRVTRRFEVDTLERSMRGGCATEATAEGRAWLARERALGLP